ncbi:GSCFA domain-containing protein [Ruegeria hyattellae]|uniref:GSCFA domain-containing protein n=1 Tax=Ruegeria hyattellae TaxID=3233337 RepID=UPI00355B0DC5
MPSNPYESQPPKAFWRSGVSERNLLGISDIFQPKFEIDRTVRISCAGSCFAQHIGAQFKKRGFNYIDLETPPPALSRERWHVFGYDLYSARYGNIYTPRQLIQMLARARDELKPVEAAYIDDNGRARDPFRPAIEPDGFADIDELESDRRYHLSQVDSMLDQTDLFVFTLGLTEAWECIGDSVVLPTCPGTVGGTFDPAKYRFKNFDYEETLQDMNAFIALAREKNPKMKFLLTVSPVPLTATATDQHVLPATIYSKSVLRAVAGALSQKHDFVDYFPSYELIASHPMRAMYYMPNLRNVAAEGVAQAMDVFFFAIGDQSADIERSDQATPVEASSDDLVCEEAILETFSQ